MIMRTVKFWQRLRGSEQIMVAAAAGLVLFLLWASIARVDEVSRGQGRVIPSSKVQIIQSAEPSTIREILVRSGQTVKKGQLLVRLDNTTSQSELGQLETENARLAQRAARLAGEGGSGAGFAHRRLRARDRLARGGEAALDVDHLALRAEQFGLRHDALRGERFEHRDLFAREAEAAFERRGGRLRFAHVAAALFDAGR